MITPRTAYNKCRFARNFTTLGKVLAVLCKNENIRREDLTDDELSQLEELENENDEMDKRIAEERKWERERKAFSRQKKAMRDVPVCPTMSQGQSGTTRDTTGQPPLSHDVPRCPNTTYLPTYLPTNNTPHTPHGGGDARFERFWREYPGPRKVDKKRCEKKFASILAAASDPEEEYRNIMDGLARWKESRDWTKEGGKFVRRPMTWLNGSNWLDRPERAERSEMSEEDEEAARNERYSQFLKERGYDKPIMP